MADHTRAAQRDPRAGITVTVSLLVFAALSGLTYLGNIQPFWFNVAVLAMLILPLLWAWRTAGWKEMGFTVKRLRAALLWGVGGGLLSAGVAVLVIGRIDVPADLPLQLAVAIPLIFLMASPFQEFFFRGWLQSRLQAALGEWPGLLAALVCFTLWHFTLPIFGAQSAFPMASLKGILGTIASGFIYSYAFHRAQNLVAPVIAHALGILAFVIIGAATFLPPS